MDYLFEIAYSPYNLRKILELSGIERHEARLAIGKSRAAFERYLHDSSNPNHATMRNADWEHLLKHIRKHYLTMDMATVSIKAVKKEE